jgi:predicted TIM-barrel fold metal-dependent hydrolase
MMPLMVPRVAGIGLAAAFLLASCHRREEPVSPRAAAAIPRFDVHSHIGPRDLSKTLELDARHRVVGLVNLSGGHGAVLEMQLAAARSYPDRVLVFASVDPKQFLEPGWVERQVQELRRAKGKGARGLKFFKALGLGYVDPIGERVKVDDPRLDPIFEECGRLGMPVSMHVGDPKAFFRPPTPDNERFEELSRNPGWSFYGRGFPRWEELFSEYERRVARHPGTQFIGVHFGNDPEEPERVAGMLDRYPNLSVDTAARVGEIGRMAPERLRAIFLTHSKRILFGTDFSFFDGEMSLGAPDGSSPGLEEADRFFSLHWRFFETLDRRIPHPTPIQGRWTVDAIGLPEDVLHDFYHRNAERMLGLAPLSVSAP